MEINWRRLFHYWKKRDFEKLIPGELEALLASDPASVAGTYPLGAQATPFASHLELTTREAAELASRLTVIGAPGARLETAQYVWREEHLYDERGNRTAVRSGWGEIRYRYDAGDRIVEAGARRYEHDGDGRLLKAEQVFFNHPLIVADHVERHWPAIALRPARRAGCFIKRMSV